LVFGDVPGDASLTLRESVSSIESLEFTELVDEGILTFPKVVFICYYSNESIESWLYFYWFLLYLLVAAWDGLLKFFW